MNSIAKRKIALFITALAGATVLAGLAAVTIASQDTVSRVPAPVLLVSAVVAFAGAIYLNAAKPVTKAAERSQSTLRIIGFAVLVVIALFFFVALIFPGF